MARGNESTTLHVAEVSDDDSEGSGEVKNVQLLQKAVSQMMSLISCCTTIQLAEFEKYDNVFYLRLRFASISTKEQQYLLVSWKRMYKEQTSSRK